MLEITIEELIETKMKDEPNKPLMLFGDDENKDLYLDAIRESGYSGELKYMIGYKNSEILSDMNYKVNLSQLKLILK